jgi:hypothetical protein
LSAHIDADHVRAELAVERILDHYGLTGTKRGGWYRLHECPRCHEKSAREAIAIEVKSGRWLHHGHERSAGGECSGDLFGLVAACESLDTSRDFARVVAIAAEVAGMSSTGYEDPATRARVEERLRARKAEEQAEFRRRQEAAVDAAHYWDALSTENELGEAYLVSRGLDAKALTRSGAVRFSVQGDVCVAIRSISGRVTTVATRFREPGDRPKVLVRRGTSTAGTMVDAIDRIRHGQPVAVIEGVIDSLTARLAWPDALIFGANGAGNLARIVRAAIGRIRLAHAPLLLVPHDDKAGIMAMTAAGEVALGAGLELAKTLHVINLPAKDLNAAWCDGWRPERIA